MLLKINDNIPTDCASIRSFFLYEYYYKKVFPNTVTYKECEKAIERMVEDETIDPRIYEHVASSNGFGIRHGERNLRGSDLIFRRKTKREVKKAFKRCDKPWSYQVNKLKNKKRFGFGGLYQRKGICILLLFSYRGMGTSCHEKPHH